MDDAEADLMWKAWQDAGHADHAGWSCDSRTRLLECACGTPVPLPAGVPA